MHHVFNQIIRVTLEVWMHMIWPVLAVILDVSQLAANLPISIHQKKKRVCMLLNHLTETQPASKLTFVILCLSLPNNHSPGSKENRRGSARSSHQHSQQQHQYQQHHQNQQQSSQHSHRYMNLGGASSTNGTGNPGGSAQGQSSGLVSQCSLHSCASNWSEHAATASNATSLSTDTLYWSDSMHSALTQTQLAHNANVSCSRLLLLCMIILQLLNVQFLEDKNVTHYDVMYASHLLIVDANHSPFKSEPCCLCFG